MADIYPTRAGDKVHTTDLEEEEERRKKKGDWKQMSLEFLV